MESKNYLHKYDSVTKELTKVPITKEERIGLIESLYAFPGEMELDERINYVNTEGLKWYNKGYYCKYTKNSRDFITYWTKQKELCYTGLLIDDKYYISGDCYFYLNFCPISFKAGGRLRPPTIRDSDIWFFQLLELSELKGKFTITLKQRQWGMTLKLLSKIIKRFWFEEGFAGKVAAIEERYVKAAWKILDMYKDHLHTYTAWKRPLDPSKMLDWQQRIKMGDGTYIGLKSELKGVVTKNNPAAVVSGKTDEIFFDEAALAKTLPKTLEYGSPALMDGDKVMGSMHMGGAAAEIKEAEGIKKLFYNPDDYNILALPNVWEKKPEQKVGIFVPAYYNFGSFTDKYGNSLIKEAKEYLKEAAEKAKKKSYAEYVTYLAQWPQTPSDSFANRDENIFPVDLCQIRKDWLENNYTPITVDLLRDNKGLTHKPQYKFPIVEEFPVGRNSYRRGAPVILEPPYPDPPFGLYYAGVDTVSPIAGITSKSLQSIYIFKASHEIDGEFSEEKIVAWYTGRFEDPYETYRVTKDLIQYYNARTLVENNNRNFLEWMIKEKQQRYLLRKSDVPIAKDVMAQHTKGADYGITITPALKIHLTSLVVEYCNEIIGVTFDANGKETDLYGVSRIPDVMLLKEMTGFTPKKNCDRCFLKDTRISTKSGIVKIQDVNKHEVTNINGRYEKVGKVVETDYSGNIYEFKLLGNDFWIKTTEEHKFYTAWSTTKHGKKPSGKFWSDKFKLNNKEWKSAKDLKKGDYLLIPKRPNLNKSNLSWFEQYLLGWYLSDGYALKCKYGATIRIHFGEDQKHIAEYIQSQLLIYDTFGRKNIINDKGVKVGYTTKSPTISRGWNGQKGWQLEFNSERFRKVLDCSVYWDSKKSNYKTLKEDLYNCKNILPLVLGIIEGDGHLKYSNFKSERMVIELSLINEVLIKQIRQILIDNGIWSTAEYRRNKGKVNYIRGKIAKFNKDQWKINISDIAGIDRILKKSNKFSKRLLKVLKRLKKRTQQKSHIEKPEGFWVPVKKINIHKYTGKVYNFESPITNTYCVENIVTHNCDAFSLALLAARSNTNRGLIVSNKKKEETQYTQAGKGLRQSMFRKTAKSIRNPFRR